MAVGSALGVASLLTQSPITSALGFLSKKKKKKAKKKAKRKAKRERQRIADELEMQGVAPAQSRQIASQRVASGVASAPSMGVNNMNPDGTEKNFLMKDYIGIGVPTIPLAGGLVLVAKQMGLFGSPKRTYRKRSRRRRR